MQAGNNVSMQYWKLKLACIFTNENLDKSFYNNSQLGMAALTSYKA